MTGSARPWGRAALPLATAALLACAPTPEGPLVTTATASAGESATESATETGETETGETTGTEEEPLAGFADLHLHMFAEDAFGGGWLHGQAVGDPAIALALCDGGEPGDHGMIRDGFAELLATCDPATIDAAAADAPLLAVLLGLGGAQLAEILGQLPGSDGDTGLHLDRRGGWPELDGWPRWDTIAHQQAWEGWLRDAYDDGLRLEVISAVSFDWLCAALPPDNRIREECDEMADVRVQLDKAHAFAAAHDWAEVALSAADARRIIADDRLALVLSVEASHILGEGPWRPGFDDLYDRGVRTLQLVHQLDNRFGGAALHNPIFHVAQFSENCHIDRDCGLTSPEVTLGFDVDGDCRNTRGLTAEGREVIAEMITRGMPIDLAHMSEVTVAEVYALAVAADYFPLYFSHAHLREIMLPAKAKEEKTTPAAIVAMVRETGGMIGLRTGAEEVNTYGPSAVANSCHGSLRSFAQAYDYGTLGLKVALGFGADFNGFIQQLRPRLGPAACSASFPEEALCQARDERQAGLPAGGSELDAWGLAHTGLLGPLVDELVAHGSDTTTLERSADSFVRMWERAEGTRSGPAAATDDLDTSGITVLPSHAQRRAALPQRCDRPYCPGGLVSGERCRFDEECEGGSCVGAGDCGMPLGTCS